MTEAAKHRENAADIAATPRKVRELVETYLYSDIVAGAGKTPGRDSAFLDFSNAFESIFVPFGVNEGLATYEATIVSRAATSQIEYLRKRVKISQNLPDINWGAGIKSLQKLSRVRHQTVRSAQDERKEELRRKADTYRELAIRISHETMNNPQITTPVGFQLCSEWFEKLQDVGGMLGENVYYSPRNGDSADAVFKSSVHVLLSKRETDPRYEAIAEWFDIQDGLHAQNPEIS